TDNTSETLSPVGQNNASKIQATNQGFGGLLRTWSSPIVSGTQYTFSVYAKAGNYRYIGLCPQLTSSYSDPLGGDKYVVYDLYSGKATNNITVLNNSATISASGMVDVGNGWYRCWITGTPGSGNGLTDISITTSTGDNNYTPAGTEYVYIYGAQLEKGSTLSSYTQTTSSQISKKLNWYDLSGNSNHFILAGTPGSGSGATPTYNSAGYFQFNGDGAYAYNTSRNWIPNNFTINVFAKDFSAGMLASSLMYFGPDHDGWRLKTVGGETYHNNSPEYYNTWSTPLAGNMFTYVHSPTYAKNYINGVETSSISASSGTYDWSNTYSRMEIGRYTLQDWNVGGYLIGKISSITAYDRALSQAEIVQNFNALRGRYSI
ncbi:hypothetical protein EB001_17120, partial [bacterium]|nr:hypothetical protein [bacterium]